MKNETGRRSYTKDILDAIAHIEEFVEGRDFEVYMEDYRTRLAVERLLEIISEASRRLPQGMKEEEDGIEWRKAAAFGNVTRHEYREIASESIWETVKGDLPPLKAAVQRMARKMDREMESEKPKRLERKGRDDDFER